MLEIELDAYDGVVAIDMRTIRDIIDQQRDELIRVEEPQAHDVVVMPSRFGGQSDGHLGIVVERRRVMHTTDPIGVQFDRLSAPHIASRILEFRRHPDISSRTMRAEHPNGRASSELTRN